MVVMMGSVDIIIRYWGKGGGCGGGGGYID